MLAGMNIHVADDRPNDQQRQLDALAKEHAKGRLFSRSRTVLSKGMTEIQESWLLDYVCSRWQALYGGLDSWRVKMGRFERMADDNYDDRKIPNPDLTDATEAVFKRQNFTLGMAAGFADFVYAQARDDIFGTRPWLAATPEGTGKIGLADVVTKNAQWKLNQSNLEPVLLDALRNAVNLGTQFVKCRWLEDIETFETAEDCAHSLATGLPFTDATGDYVLQPEHLPAGTDPADVEWRELLIQNTDKVYSNIEASCLDFKNIAFDGTAPELDLRYTDFMHRFEVGAHDICNAYEFDEATRQELLTLVDVEERTAPREHRDETDADRADPYRYDPGANPKVTLVEGFFRCAPLGNGRVIRVACVFSPTLRIMFHCEYLANVTPRGMLPVFPVRCFKTPGRITGKGYFEKYEDANTAVDGQYNSVTLHNRKASEVIKGIHRSALENGLKRKNIVLDPDTVFELAEDKNITDFVQFAVIPDNENRSVELLNQMTQMNQARSGITSAAQGELKGMPSSNTAAGVNQIVSRGAVLVKWPIDQMKTDVTAPVSFAVHCHYANHDHDETFTWGEGKDAELLELKKADVKNLRAKVTLTMSQSQGQEKLQSSQVGIAIASQYALLPETEKTSQRRLYIQALAALGFQDADRIIREAAVTPEGILAILPPDLQAAFQAFLQSAAIAPAPDAGLPPAATPPAV
jgi:hypothetical protein